MVKAKTWLRRYGGRWVVRWVTNFVRLSLWTTLAGYLMVTLILLSLMVTNNQSPISPVAQVVVTLAKGFNVMLARVTNGGDFEGGFLEIGTIVMAFLAPYLFWGSALLAVAETLIGKSLMGRCKVSLQRQLQGIFGLWLLFSAVAVFHSVVPPSDLPYGVRVVLLAGLFGFIAFQLVLLRVVSIVAAAVARSA